ncbi:MAG: hypothetical protein KGJ90_00055 [Patescibacteria group bacterium]|nr:hypothetical protein [Patescibacteria group bacterium]
MKIIFRHMPDGAFVCGDLESGRTAYAYPTSQHAIKAQKSPDLVAETMLENENDYGQWRNSPLCQDFDKRQWKRLNG